MHHSILWSQVPNSFALFRSQSASAFSFLLCRMTSKTYRSWLWSLRKKTCFLFSPHSCYNWTWIQVFVGIERHFTCPDFSFWSWLRPRPCQILIQRSLGHFLYCAEALTSPQAHVAFNGWTLQSTADLLFAKGAPRRKQKSLACAQDRSLTAVLQWTELCMTACNPPFQTGKQSAHSGFARYLPHLQLL